MDDDKERLGDLSQQTIQVPLSGLIAQCYGTFKANTDPDEFSLDIFTDIFHRVCIGMDGIILLMWDDETDRYYSIHIPKIEIFDITERAQPPNTGLMELGGPIFDVSFKVYRKVDIQGNAEDLFHRSTDIRQLIEEGWENVNRQFAIPTNHITPFDLCALANLHELTYRLTWFIEFMLDYKSPFNLVRTIGATAVDKGDILAMSLFFNQSLQLFATLIKQPQDMEPYKRYIVRGYADFHQRSVDNKFKSFVKEMYVKHGAPEPNTEFLTTIETAYQPDVMFLTLTTVYLNG